MYSFTRNSLARRSQTSAQSRGDECGLGVDYLFYCSDIWNCFFLNKRRKDELKWENKIIDRDPIFFKREHYFECLISTLREIGEELDKSVLSSEGIPFEPDYASEKIIFHNNVSFGTFGAALRAVGNEEGVYKYRFCVKAWREQGYGISRQDYFGANVLLTVIERAFLRLDPKTKVFDKAMKITNTHKK